MKDRFYVLIMAVLVAVIVAKFLQSVGFGQHVVGGIGAGCGIVAANLFMSKKRFVSFTGGVVMLALIILLGRSLPGSEGLFRIFLVLGIVASVFNCIRNIRDFAANKKI